MTRTLSLSLALSLAAAATLVPAHPAHAEVAAARASVPGQMVLANTQRVLATLEKRRPEFTRNRQALYAFIGTEFNQMFDRNYASRLVLGPVARSTSPAEIEDFAQALADNLMRRYGASLLDFNTRLTPRIKSEVALPNGFGMRINSELVRGGGDPIPVTYLMHQVGGTWKVYDVQIEGISMISTFRSQFAAPLQQKGVRGVTADLRAGRVQANARK